MFCPNSVAVARYGALLGQISHKL
ncbi:MAG: hypothetical protein ACLT4D_00940 [Blautia faecis]